MNILKESKTSELNVFAHSIVFINDSIQYCSQLEIQA